MSASPVAGDESSQPIGSVGISVMLFVPDARGAASWDRVAFGAEVRRDLGSVVKLHIRGARFSYTRSTLKTRRRRVQLRPG